VVTNTDNGDEATSSPSQTFTYIPVVPLITSVVPGGLPPFTIGSPFTVTVQNPGIGPLGNAIIGFTIGDRPVTPSPQTITTGTGSQIFTMSVPVGITFPTLACTVGTLAGTQSGPATVNVTFNNLTTACTATATNGLTISPSAAAATCVTVPHATVTSPSATCPNLSPASQTATGNATQTATITIANAATSDTLTLSAPTVTPLNATVVVAPNTAQQVPGGNSVSYTVTVDPTAAGPDGATITFATNDPAAPTITVIVCGSATP
jgi:hypothetical protein